MVVAYHGALELINFGTLGENFPGSSFFRHGEAGVDLFFVISGFVIFYSLTKSGVKPKHFFVSRVSRVVPLYWFYTALMVLGAVLAPGALRSQWDSPWYVAKSLLFVPAARTDGLIQPVLALGWTLNYEMFFYLILGVASLWLRKVSLLLLGVSGVLVILVAQQHVFQWTTAPMVFWSSAIVIEFVLGASVFFIYSRFDRLPIWAGAALIIAGLLMIFFNDTSPTLALDRLLCYGFGSAGILLGLLVLNRFFDMAFALLVGIGNWSYSLYLLHMFPLRLSTKVAGYLTLSPAASILAVVAGGALAVYLAKLSYTYIELPLTNFVKRLLTAKVR